MVAGLGVAKIVGSMMLGQTSLGMFKASLTGQPIFFVAMLAFWAFVLAGGLLLAHEALIGGLQVVFSVAFGADAALG